MSILSAALRKPLDAYRQLRDAGREHTQSVNETWYQHAKAATRFTIKFSGFVVKTAWHAARNRQLSSTDVGAEILTLGVEMAVRNPASLQKAKEDAEQLGPINNRFRIPSIFLGAAWRTAIHAVLPGAYPVGGSRRIVRVARSIIPDFDDKVAAAARDRLVKPQIAVPALAAG